MRKEEFEQYRRNLSLIETLENSLSYLKKFNLQISIGKVANNENDENEITINFNMSQEAADFLKSSKMLTNRLKDVYRECANILEDKIKDIKELNDSL